MEKLPEISRIMFVGFDELFKADDEKSSEQQDNETFKVHQQTNKQ